MNKKDYQKPSIWVVRFQFPQGFLQASGGIKGTRVDYDTESDEEWDESKNSSSIWN